MVIKAVHQRNAAGATLTPTVRKRSFFFRMLRQVACRIRTTYGSKGIPSLGLGHNKTTYVYWFSCDMLACDGGVHVTGWLVRLKGAYVHDSKFTCRADGTCAAKQFISTMTTRSCLLDHPVLCLMADANALLKSMFCIIGPSWTSFRV